jgi:hypothetical protein
MIQLAVPKFDLAQTQAIADLFAEPRESRDETWREKFYAAAPDATLMAFDPQVSQGPDEFPYFHLAIPDPGPVTPFCITHLLDVVLDNGLGIAIFGDSSRSEDPEWVFTYGDLLSYSLFGHFDGDPAGRLSSGGSKQDQVLVAAPSEDYLPARARKAMGNFVRRMYHHPDPRIALVCNPQATLMINLTLADYGDEDTLRKAVHYLCWYLPRTYRVAPMPAGWTDSSFVPLG